MSMFDLYLEHNKDTRNVDVILNTNQKLARMIESDDLYYFDDSVLSRINFFHIKSSAITRFLKISTKSHNNSVYMNIIKTLPDKINLPVNNGKIEGRDLEEAIVSSMRYNSFKMLREVLIECINDSSISVSRIIRVFYNENTIHSVAALSSEVIGAIINCGIKDRKFILAKYLSIDEDGHSYKHDLSKGYTRNINLINNLPVSEISIRFPSLFDLIDYREPPVMKWLLASSKRFEYFLINAKKVDVEINLEDLYNEIELYEEFQQSNELKQIRKDIMKDYIIVRNLTPEQIIYRSHIDVNFLHNIAYDCSDKDQAYVFSTDGIDNFTDVCQLRYQMKDRVSVILPKILNSNFTFINTHYFHSETFLKLKLQGVNRSFFNPVAFILRNIASGYYSEINVNMDTFKLFIQKYKIIVDDYIQYLYNLDKFENLANMLLTVDAKHYSELIFQTKASDCEVACCGL